MAKLKSQRFEPVNQIVQKKEREAATDFGTCMGQVQAMENQLKKLYQYRDDYNKQFGQSSNQGMSSSQIQDYLMFINNINHNIDKILENIEIKKKECEGKKQVWLAKHQQVRIYDKVKDKYLTAEQLQRDKIEQKQNDEFSQGFFHRRHKPNI